MNSKVTLIIPVRRNTDRLRSCLRSALSGTVIPQVIVMDCTADSEALGQVRAMFPDVRVFDFGMNPGRAHAVNTGIHITRTPYVMTLSPRLLVGKHCIERLCEALDADNRLFSAQAKILSAEDPSRIVGAGWTHTTLHPRGRRRAASWYSRKVPILAAQMDAALYRMEYLEVTGLFDERFYRELEDLDLGYRALIAGFSSIYMPTAVCKETEPAPPGSFYEQLKIGNMEYFRYKYGLKSLKGPGNEADPERKSAIERGRMLCFQAEIEQMERQELGMSVTKRTLPEEFFMEIREDGPENVYPLYLGSRAEDLPPWIPAFLRTHVRLLTETMGSVRNLFLF